MVSGVDAARRREVARLGAPVLALAVATGAVLLARAALDRGGRDDGTPAAAPPRAAKATLRPSAKRPSRQPPAPAPVATYVVRSGDTLAAIAARRRTTVDRLLELNPGIDPAALVVGRPIRVSD
jgi:Tfp pilus assembly protein FimV